MRLRRLQMLFVILFAPVFLMAQDYSINRGKDNILLIGMNNVLHVEGFTREDSLHVEVLFPISARKAGRQQFILTATTPKENIPIIIKNRNEVIDTALVSTIRTTLDQHIVTQDFGLIKSGEYPLEIVKSIQSISVSTNIPWLKELKILGYRIEIHNVGDILFIGEMDGESFNQPALIKALKNLKKGGIVDIKKIFAKTPWDDGKQPKRVVLQVK